jgi:CDP-4-dehydro-6-deoxyglucose reductase
MAAQSWQNGKVIRIEDETASTKRFWIELTESERFDFISGQFVTLELPIHEQQSKRARSYSIASAPNGTNVFELVIVLMEGGLGTTDKKKINKLKNRINKISLYQVYDGYWTYHKSSLDRV